MNDSRKKQLNFMVVDRAKWLRHELRPATQVVV
jgi:hypothetical protein